VDDHTLFREGVARLLAAEPDIQLVAHCASTKEAFDILKRSSVDLVLLDYDLGTETGTQFLKRAQQHKFAGRVLMLTAGLSNDVAKDMLALGASGIFLKNNPPAMLSKTIRQIMEGWTCIDQRYLRAVFQSEMRQEPDQKPSLSNREREVLRAVLEGCGNKEIAARLAVSESTVKAIMQQLFNKTGVRTRSQLVRIALEQYKDQL
jgi:two-component system nitrate/nitrite response regulator NarL